MAPRRVVPARAARGDGARRTTGQAIAIRSRLARRVRRFHGMELPVDPLGRPPRGRVARCQQDVSLPLCLRPVRRVPLALEGRGSPSGRVRRRRCRTRPGHHRPPRRQRRPCLVVHRRSPHLAHLVLQRKLRALPERILPGCLSRVATRGASDPPRGASRVRGRLRRACSAGAKPGVDGGISGRARGVSPPRPRPPPLAHGAASGWARRARLGPSDDRYLRQCRDR